MLGTIIAGVFGLLGGVSTTLLFFKEKKQGAKIEVSEKEVDLSGKSLEVLNQSFSTFLKSNEMKEKQIDKLEDIVNDLKRELNKCKLQIIEQERKINGMQSQLTKAHARAEESDALICFNKKCDLRKPELGTYRVGGNDNENENKTA